MSTLSTSVCQACLVSNVKMHSIEDLQLLELYNKLTSSIPTRYSMSYKLCFICFSQLLKCYKFSLMAQNSKQILEDKFHNFEGQQNTTPTIEKAKIYHNLKVTRIWYVSINESSAITVNGDKVALRKENKNIYKTNGRTHTPVQGVKIKDSKSKNILPKHKKKKPRKTYVCTTCNAYFTQSKSLSVHMRIHTKEKPYTCNTCQKTFSDGSSLRKHKRTHTGEKPYECDICHTKFTCKSSVATHMRIHFKEKLYTCKQCDKKFILKHALLIHERNHTGEKPYICDTCNKTFKSRNSIQKHVPIHMKVELHSCIKCDKKFTHKSNMTRHLFVVHNKRLLCCKLCDMTFKTKNELKMHDLIHSK